MLFLQVFIITAIATLIAAAIKGSLKGKLFVILLESAILTVPIYTLLLFIKALEKYVGV